MTTYEQDQANFRSAVTNNDWLSAAEILQWYTDTKEDAQDWLSHGDLDYMLNTELKDLAAEWDNLNAQ